MIRPADQSDLAAVRSLDRSRIRSSTSQSVTEILELTQPQLLVADVDGAIVGLAVVGRFFEYDFLELLFVGADYRRRGIGTELIRAAETVAMTGKLFTSTNDSNEAMKELCEKLGFVRSGVLDGLEADDPEIFYVKSLPRSNATPAAV
jgi:GNAT superfamily N-acetyltransferase